MSEIINPIDEDFLAEDGHPIGQLALVNSEPAVVVDHSIEEAEAQLVAVKEEELGTDLELYPGYEDMDKRQKAKHLFIVDQLPTRTIATRIGVPERTVTMWVYNERWDSVVRKSLMVQDMQSRLELAKLRADSRNRVALEQLEQAKKIRQAAIKAVDEGRLKGATDAWAQATKVEQTILGIKEGGDIASVDGKSEEENSSSKKQPLVVVFNNGLPTASRR